MLCRVLQLAWRALVGAARAGGCRLVSTAAAGLRLRLALLLIC